MTLTTPLRGAPSGNRLKETLPLTRLRGTDSNSLLRFYDEVHRVLERSQSQQERERAEALERIATELRKRNFQL